MERRQRVHQLYDEVEEAAEEDDGDGRRDEDRHRPGGHHPAQAHARPGGGGGVDGRLLVHDLLCSELDDHELLA